MFKKICKDPFFFLDNTTTKLKKKKNNTVVIIELLSLCLTLSYIVFTPSRYMGKFQGILYLTKFEEGPEHPLDTGDELLSV